MTNKYLEKLAADYSLQKEAGNAYKNFLASKGRDVSGISNSSLVSAIPGAKKPGSFSTMSNKANKAGVMPSAKMSPTARVKALAGRGTPLSNTVNHGFKSQVRAATGVGLGLSSGAAARAKDMATRGESLGTALKNHIASKQTAAPAAVGGVKGYLNKAIGFAKAHPKGLALGAAGAVGGLALASRMGKSQEPQYQGMY